MGSALHISLPSGLKSGQSLDVKITYKTTKDCTALQWLDKEYEGAFSFSVPELTHSKADSREDVPVPV